jgi:hypothetical protein
MKRIAPAPLPRKRVHRLVIDELPDEVLVYDLDRHKAHCLNKTAALVWQHCDGKSNALQISRRLTRELQAPFNEDLVWLALRQLEKLHLLEQPISLPSQFAGITRREMVRTLGIAAVVAVPLVTSIVSPTPAEAATCVGAGAVCGGGINCCPGHLCSGGHCT